MDIVRRFACELATGAGDSLGDTSLLPFLLTQACNSVLGADGVGLSVHGDGPLRTPLAASNEPAATVETLQFTAGEGPCMVAAEYGLPVFASEDLLSSRWPIFYDMVVSRTPVRSLLALPLPGALRGLVVLDVCFTDAAGVARVDLVAARAIARTIADRLELADWSPRSPGLGPPWLDTPEAQARAEVWIALGMISVSETVSAVDALALLRGHAYAVDRTVDALAADVVARRTTPSQLRHDAEGDR